MSFIVKIRRVLCREAKRIAERKSYLALLTLLPAVAFLLFGLLFLRPVTSLPIALCDSDNTPTSRRLASMVDATAGADVRYGVQSADEGHRLIRQGKVYALLIIPEGFELALLSGRQAKVRFCNSGANLTTNGILGRDVQSAVQTFSVGTQLEMFEAQGVVPDEALAMAMPVVFDQHILFNPRLDYAAYLAPTFMALMLLVFTTLSTIYAIGSELKEGATREWLAAAEGSMWAAVVGKLALPTVAMMAWGGVMFFILFVLLGVPMSGDLGVLALATAIFIVSYEAVGVVFVALFDNMRVALSLGGGYSVLSFSFSGVTFPSMAMYVPIRLAGNIFPFTFYMKIYVDLAVRGVPVGYVLDDVAVMMLFWLLPMLALPRLRKMCEDERYWYKS